MATNINGSSLNDSANFFNQINTLTGAPSTNPASLSATIVRNGTTSVTPTFSDGHINISLGAGNDTLIAKNMVWATGDSSSNIAFSTINMGLGNDSIDLDRVAVRRVLDAGGGDDTLRLHNSYANSVNMGAGNDRVEVSGDPKEVSAQELQLKADNAVDNPIDIDGGAGGTDTLGLVGPWTITFNPGSSVFLNKNGVLSTQTSLAHYDLKYIYSNTADLAGVVRFPATQMGTVANYTPFFNFTNFDRLEAICFTEGMPIKTATGTVKVEDLKIGDKVLTRTGEKAISWIGKRRLDVVDLAGNPKLLPIRIPAGAFGGGLPESDVVLSPQHRVVVRSEIAARMFGAPEVLAPVKQLVGVNGIAVDGNVREVVYYHIMFDEHTTVFVEGIEAEALYPGPEALKAVSKEALEEIFTLFPELAEVTEGEYRSEFVLPVLKGRDARALAARHVKNERPLYA